MRILKDLFFSLTGIILFGGRFIAANAEHALANLHDHASIKRHRPL